MFAITQKCPICQDFSCVYFYKCINGALILICDECNLAWSHPEYVPNGPCLSYNLTTGYIAELYCSVSGGHWATFDEIPLSFRRYVVNPPVGIG